VTRLDLAAIKIVDFGIDRLRCSLSPEQIEDVRPMSAAACMRWAGQTSPAKSSPPGCCKVPRWRGEISLSLRSGGCFFFRD
jgi:hypothetical protein